MSFDSPRGRFRVQVQAEDAGGRDLMPLAIILSPTDGTAPETLRVQARGYKVPSERELKRMFHFSPDESVVAIENPRSLTIGGFRIVPLTRRPWPESDIEAEWVAWPDRNRMVYRGLGPESYFIGVFDVRTGRLWNAYPNLPMGTNFEVIKVSPRKLTFRLEDEAGVESCFTYDTKRGKRRQADCPE